MAENNLVAYLKLDSKEFKQGAADAAKSMAAIGAGMAALGTGVLIAAVEASKYADEMAKAAKASGVTTEEFSRLNYAANLAGVGTEGLEKALTRLKHPNAEAQSAFSQLGITVTDSSGHFKDSTVLLSETAEKMSQLTDPASKATAALMIFGKRSVEMVKMLDQGADGLKRMALEADAFGQVVSSEAGENAEKFNENLKRLELGAKGVNNVLSESIIEMINTSGIMESMQESSKNTIAMWRGLSDETKHLVLEIAGFVTIGGVVLMALAAISAVLPFVIAGFGLLLSPITLVIAAAGGLSYALIKLEGDHEAATKSSASYVAAIDKQNHVIEEAGSYYRELEGHSASAAIQNGNVRKSVEQLTKVAGDFNVSLLDQAGNYRKIADVMDEINAKRIQSAIIQLSQLYIEYQQQKAMIESQEIGLNSATWIEKQTEAYKLSAVILNQRKTALLANIEQQKIEAKLIQDSANPAIAPEAKKKKEVHEVIPMEIVYKSDIISAITEIDKVKQISDAKNVVSAQLKEKLANDEIAAQKKVITGTQQQAVAYAKLTEVITKTIDSAAKPFGDLMNNINAGIAYRAQVAQRDLDIQTAQSAVAYEQQKNDLTASEDAKIAKINDSYDAQIKAIQDGEDAKNNIEAAALAERLLMMDTEYQAQKAALEQAFQDQLDAAQASYDLKHSQIDQGSADKEEAYLADNVLDADYQQLQANMQKDHLAKMADFDKTYQAKITAQTKLSDDKNKSQKVLDDAQIKALEDQKAAALVNANAQKDSQLAALDAARSAQEKAEAKQRLQIQYDAEMDQYNNSLAIKIVQTEAAGIAAAAQAFAGMVAAAPWGAGEIAGAIIAGVILASTQVAVGNLIASKPIKPAGLMMAEGGVLSGPSHADGGIPLTAEGGEGVIDKIRSQKLIQAVDNSINDNGRIINLYFYAGAFAAQEFKTRENVAWFADELGREIGGRVGLR